MKPCSKFHHGNAFPMCLKGKFFDYFSFSTAMTVVRSPIRDTGGAQSTPDEKSSSERSDKSTFQILYIRTSPLSDVS